VALGLGGALETVVDGETGVLTKDKSVDALVEAILRAEAIDWDTRTIRRNAERFAAQKFLSATEAFMADAMEKGNQTEIEAA